MTTIDIKRTKTSPARISPIQYDKDRLFLWADVSGTSSGTWRRSKPHRMYRQFSDRAMTPTTGWRRVANRRTVKEHSQTPVAMERMNGQINDHRPP